MITSTSRPSEERLLPVLLKGYFLGTVIAAIVLHVAIALIAPGDGGTLLALVGGGIFPIVLIAVGIIGFVVFPLAAIGSWPLRRWTIERPRMALLLAGLCGLVIGAAVTASGLQIGPGDFWAAPLAGLAYGIVWFLVVRRSQRLGSF